MTAIQIIGLLALIVSAAILAAFLFQSGKNTQEELPTIQTFTPEELENIKLAEELYNKDLRPVVAKKSKPVVAQELEVIEPEFVAKVVQVAKVLPPEATINAEGVKPVKKKRKYYPKTKK